MNRAPQQTEKTKNILDYRPPERSDVSDQYVIVACVLAFALFVAMSLAGVASDFTRILLPKKIALTVASIAVIAVIIRAGARRRGGCATLATLYILFAAMEVAVMWFWN